MSTSQLPWHSTGQHSRQRVFTQSTKLQDVLYEIRGPIHDHAASLPEVASGTYRTVLPNVKAGMWSLTIEAYKGSERMFMSRNQLRLVR